MKLSDPQRITSMAFNPARNVLYFVVSSPHRQSEIMMLDAKTSADSSTTTTMSMPKSLLHGHGIKHIAYDWVANNLYYAADGGNHCHFAHS